MTFFDRLKHGWTFLKFIRVGLGSLILYSSVQSGQIGGMIAGGIFTLFALFTDGVCCTGGSCYTPNKMKTSSSDKETEYEELVSK